MASKPIVRARVGESCSSTGTGDAILSGALAGHIAFSAIPGIAHGDPVNYLLKAPNGQWEVGEGTYLTLFGPAVPRIWRQTPKESSSGDGVNVNFAVAPECYLTMTARSSRTHGAYAKSYPGANQVIAAATAIKVAFDTSDYQYKGYAGAASYWNGSLQEQSSFNELGVWNINAKVDAVATFAGDSYLAIYKNGVEYARGVTLSGSKSLVINADVPLLVSSDVATVYIFSTTGGTILGADSKRSWCYSRWVHPGE